MRVVYKVGDGPLEGATYALESRLAITEELIRLKKEDGRLSCSARCVRTAAPRCAR